MGSFKAIVIEKADKGQTVSLTQFDEANLMEGDVTVAVQWSTLNYKDGLAITGRAPVVRRFPMIPGIDFAGVVDVLTGAARPLSVGRGTVIIELERHPDHVVALGLEQRRGHRRIDAAGHGDDDAGVLRPAFDLKTVEHQGRGFRTALLQCRGLRLRHYYRCGPPPRNERHPPGNARKQGFRVDLREILAGMEQALPGGASASVI